jgi:hypothetical protein
MSDVPISAAIAGMSIPIVAEVDGARRPLHYIKMLRPFAENRNSLNLGQDKSQIQQASNGYSRLNGGGSCADDRNDLVLQLRKVASAIAASPFVVPT